MFPSFFSFFPIGLFLKEKVLSVIVMERWDRLLNYLPF
jgi:hypothetical protein